MSPQRVLAILVLSCFTFASSPCRTQTTASVLAAPRDPAALALLAQALKLAGGASAWQAVHGTRVTGTVDIRPLASTGSEDRSRAIEMVDDWSTGRLRYTRSNTDSKGNAHIQRRKGDATLRVNAHGKTLTIRQFDTTSVLLVHMPAASLAMLLRDKSYSVATASSKSDANHSKVLVKNAGSTALQVWSLSNQTGQVNSVQFTVPDVMNPRHPVWETVVYDHFRSDEGMLVPDKVTLIRPGGTPIIFKFTSFERNPSVSDSDFKAGSGK